MKMSQSLNGRTRGRGMPVLACFVLCALLSLSGCSMLSLDKRSVYKFNHEFPVADATFSRSLSAFGSTMVGGNRAEILNNGDEYFPAMVQAIREAKRTVNLEAYIYKSDRAGEMMTQALIDAARRGVEVRVLVDGTGSKYAGPHLVRMRQAGVQAEKFHPVRLWSIYKIARRTHRKILVVDGTISFTGGFCIADAWLGNARNPKEWRDLVVRVNGPVSAQMQAIFSEDWTYTTGEILAGDKFYPRIEPAGDVPAQAIKASRGDSSSLAAMLYYMAIQSAAKSIH